MTFLTKIKSLQQDDAVCQMRNLGIQYKELEQERERTENRLAQLQKSMCEVEEGKLRVIMLLSPFGVGLL